MKRTLSMIALAALTIGLLGSCSKINERLDNLEKEVSGIENEQIASINSQISGITSSISDLGQIRSDISSLKQSASDHSVDIFNLEEADRALKDRILNLEDYVDAVLPNYAEKEWVEATFSTLEQYEATCDTIAKIDARIGALDAKLSKDIKATADSLTKWVNKQFEGYYTAAQMDAKLAQMKAAVDSAKASGGITDAKADSIATELTATKTAVDTAKAAIRAEYKAAVKSAIEESEGKLTKALNDAIATVNGTITALTGRVDALDREVDALTGRVKALEEMIQSVVIVPAYSDGSVEAINGIVELNLIVSPSSAVEGLTNEKVNILLNTVATKAVSVDTVEADKIKSFTVDKTKGTVEIKADISDKINALQSKQLLTIAVNVTNGDLSDFTTEFVGVKTVVKTLTFKAVYDTNNEANTLTFYYDYIDHSGEGITVYDNLPSAAAEAADWGYNSNRGKIKSVVIDASVASYSGLTSTACMFHDMTIASSIEGAEYLDVSNVTNMMAMFWNFGSDKSSTLELAPEVENWKTGQVTTMQNMFMNYGAGPGDFNDVPNVSNWDTRNVTNMSSMFKGFASTSEELECAPKVNGTNWKTDEVTDMSGMFCEYGKASKKLKEAPDVISWNTQKVTKMGDMFLYYGYTSTALNTVPDVSGWNTINVTTMANMFQNYGYSSTALSTVPNVSNWKTGKVTSMTNMFNGYGYTSTNISCVLDLSGWDLSKITSGDDVFKFKPSTFDVTIPAKTGEKSNEGGKWYYGNGANSITPPTGKIFTPAASTISTIADVLATAGDNAPSATNHWYDTKGNNNIYTKDGQLFVDIYSAGGASGTLPLSLDNTVTPNGDNYLYSNWLFSFTFNMTEGVLTSIYVDASAYGVNDTFSPAGTLEYVEIGGLKWATKNLGAEKVTDYGDYFAWGETAPYYEGTGGWPATPTWKSGKESGYAWLSYCSSSSFSEWSTPPYDATTKILKPEFDAAAGVCRQQKSSRLCMMPAAAQKLLKQAAVHLQQKRASTGAPITTEWQDFFSVTEPTSCSSPLRAAAMLLPFPMRAPTASIGQVLSIQTIQTARTACTSTVTVSFRRAATPVAAATRCVPSSDTLAIKLIKSNCGLCQPVGAAVEYKLSFQENQHFAQSRYLPYYAVRKDTENTLLAG